MAELTVCRAANHFAVVGAELIAAITEGDDLGGTDKREVERVEEQHDVLASVVFE
jgi:hypothetical protein